MFGKSSRLKSFIWQGQTKDGLQIRGEIEAINIRFAKSHLQESEIIIEKIAVKRFYHSLGFKKRLSRLEIILFLASIKTFLETGIELEKALLIICKNSKTKKIKQFLSLILLDIHRGNSFSQSLSRYRSFASMIPIIANSERCGNMIDALENIVNYLEEGVKSQKRVIKTLIYPILVMGASFLVIILIFQLVIPKFQNLFAGFDASLPKITQILISCATFLNNHFAIITVSAIFLCTLLLLGYKKSRKIRRLIDQLILYLPIWSKIVEYTNVINFIRTIDSGYRAGIPILESISMAKKVQNNLIWKERMDLIYQKIHAGETFAQAMQGTHLFPDMVIQLITIGEKSGKLSHILKRIIILFESDLHNLTDTILKLIEPFIIIALSLFVGGLIIAIYLPIFKLGMII